MLTQIKASLVILSFTFITFLSGCAQQPNKVVRHVINSWEPEIGYSEVVQVNDTYYISGVACAGKDYQAAVEECYQTLGKILARLHLSEQNVVKETIYALDIEELKKQIPTRKQFYASGTYPAATWVQIDRLFDSHQIVEIEFVAVK